jgi:hypothetical protein
MTFGDMWVTVALLFLIVGVYWLTGREVLAEASNKWPTVEGVVVRLRYRASRIWPTGRRVQYPVVIYEYVLEGRTYSSRRISLGVSRGRLLKLTEGYEEGGKVLVYYRPDHPSMSVLVPGGSAIRKLFLEAGGPFSFLAMVGLLLFLVYQYFSGS